MKKKIMSATLALVMLFALLPVTAQAAYTGKTYNQNTTLTYDWYETCKIIGSSDPANPVVITINNTNGGTKLQNSLSVSGANSDQMAGGFTIASGYVKITGGDVVATIYRVKSGSWNYQGPMLTVNAGATLTLENVNIHGTNQEGVGVTAKCAAIRNFGTLIMEKGAKIDYCTGNYADEPGGGIYNKGTLVMNKGSIKTCSASNNGAKTNAGGGIYNEGGSIEINGGTISNDCTAPSGGGVYMNGGTLVLNGGGISGATDTADKANGALNATNGASVTMNGGYIAGMSSVVPDNTITGTLGTTNLKLYVYVEDGSGVHSAASTEIPEYMLTVHKTATVTSKSSSGATLYTGLYDAGTQVWNFQIVPTGVTLSESSKSLDYPNNTSFSLTATVAPENAHTKTLTWESSNESVATVSGGTVTLQGTGSATITATTFNGKSASCALTVTASHVHSYTTASNESGHWTECSCGDKTATEAHTPVTDAAVAATCTATGKTEGSHCSFCGEILTAQTTVPALGHDYAATVTAPACTERGYTTHTCSRCNDSYVDAYVNALGHSWGNWVVTTPAACTTAGVETRTCTRDGRHTETQPITATGHTEVTDPGVASTCTGTGLTQGSHCSVCGATLVAQTVVPALGHSYGTPSYTWNGTSCAAQRTCTRSGCTHKETETVTAAVSITQQKSCTLEELSTYTADFSNSAFARQTKTNVKTAEKLNHDYSTEFTIDTPATCEAAGSKSRHCSRCDSTTEVTAIPATGHEWGEWISNNDGTETRTCANDASHIDTRSSTYTITYAGMDGAAHGTNHPTTHTYGTSTSISDPSKHGYTFAGWQVNSGNRIKNLTLSGTGYTSDITLTAHWTLNAPTVELTATPADGSAAYGTAVTLTAAPSHALTSGVSYDYEWYKGGTKIDGTANTLTLSNVADSGNYTVKVTANDGSQTSAATISSAVIVTVSAAAHDTPDAPSLTSKTYNSIIATAVSGQKYICQLADAAAPATGATGWQDTGAFTGLNPNTAYKIYTYTPSPDENHTASDVSEALEVTTSKVKITSVTAPVNTTLTDYCATGDAVKAKLSASAVCVSEDSKVTSLGITWTPPATYAAAPGATNSFTWSVSAPTNYEFSTGVVTSGSVTVTNKAATAVSITGVDKQITYDGGAYDVSAMFTIPSTAGTASYSIITGGSGAGTLSGSTLTISKAGTIRIKVTTAPNGNYAAGSAEATLTVNKGSVTVPTITGKIYTGQTLTADVTGGDADNSYAVTKNDGGIGVGNYDVVLTLNKPDLYQWSDGTTTAAKTLTFTISQATNEWKTALACPGFTYDGATTLAPAAQAKFGKVSFTYAAASDGAYTELPAGGIRDAGTYYIKAAVDGNTNYTGLSAGPVTVTIGKVKLTPSVASVAAREYDGGMGAEGTISLSAAQGSIPAGESPSASGTFTWTAKNAGAATVNVSDIALTNADVNKNYELASASLTNISAPGEVKISPKALDIPAQALTYNGTTTYAVENYATGVSGETITLTYTPAVKDAGAYALGAAGKGFALALSDGNYSVSSAGTLTIEPKPLTAPAKTVTYNGGVSFTQEVDGVNGEKVTITYTAGSKNAASYGYAGAAAADKYTAAGSANYTVTGGGTLTISQLTAELTWSGDGESTYNGSPRSVTAAVANKVTGDAVNVIVSGGTKTDASTAAYAATATGLTGDDAENYKLPASPSTTYIIKQKDISGATVTLGAGLTYNGTEQTQEVTSVTIDGLTATFGVSGNKETGAKSDYTLTVTGSGNFTGTETATWGIAQKPLTITAKAQTIIFGEAISTGTAQVEVSGLAVGDTLYSIALEPSGSEVAGKKTIAPDTAVIKRGGSVVTGNYAIAYKTGTLTITNATMTPTVSGYDNPYDGKAHGISVTMNGAEIKYGTESGTYNLDASPTYTDADEYTVYYRVTKANYTTVTDSATVKITPKSIAAVWTGENGSRADFSWVYDGTPHAPTAMAATDVDSETVTLSIAGAATDYKASAYTATASIDPANGNYALTNTTQTFNITKADYDMSGVTFVDASAEYDGGAHSLTVTGTLPTGEDGKPVTVRYSGAATNVSDGAVTVTATFSTQSANYNTPAAKTAKITITPAALTVTANAHTVTYGDALTDNGVSYDGFVTGENAANVTFTGTLGYDYDYEQYDDIGSGSYIITPKGITATNYAITFASGALTVNPRPITVTIADKSSAYGARLQTLTATVTTGNIVNSDSVYSLATTATPTSTVSDYAITGSATDSNYTVTFMGNEQGGSTGTYSITAAALIGISVTGYSETYDGQSHDADASRSATAVNGQTVTWKFGRTADTCTQDHLSVRDVADSGTYYYEVSSPNHTVVTGHFTVTVSEKDISGATVTLGDALTYTGAEQTQEVTGVSIGGLDVTYEVSGDKETTAGSYALTVSGTGNFTGTQTQQFTIAPKPVTLTWDYTAPFTYDTTVKTVTASVSNPIAGDTFTLSYAENSKTDADSYTAAVTGLGNSNYTLAGATGTSLDWVIKKTPVSFTVSDNGYVYNNTARTATVAQTAVQLPAIGSGFTVGYKLPGEEISDATASKTDAGEYDIIVTLSDDNFRFDGQADTVRSLKVGTLTIDKKPVTAQWKNLSHVYDGSVKTPTFDFANGDILPADVGADNVSVVLTGDQSKSAGSYPVHASLEGARAHNYALTNPTGSFVIQRAPVTFTVTNDSVQHDGNSHAAAVTANIDAAKYTVTYRDSRGNTVNAPTDAGSYDIYAAITDINYRHAGAADGAARKIGVLTIYRYTAPAVYTVSFEGGVVATGTTVDLAAAQAGTVRILPDCGFSLAGNTFTGWKYGGSIYQPGERLTQPTANITMTAQWAEDTYTIAGVVDQNNLPLADVVVTLMLGSEQVNQTATSTDGHYSFDDILPGLYNLVARKNGVTQTVLVEIVAEDATEQTITMPSGKTNSVVEIAAGSPAIVVGNLEQSFAATENNPCFNETDQQAVTDGGTVEIKLTASAASNTVTAIEDAARGTVGLCLDMTLTKTVTPLAGSVTTETLSQSASLLEMVINLPGELQGKDAYTVYRVHEGVTGTLTSTPNDAGEYIRVNAEKTVITVCAKYFSTYAVAFTTYSGGTTTTYKPVIAPTEHGSVMVRPNPSAAGAKVTITLTPEEGYEPASCKVTDRDGKEVALTQNSDRPYSFTQPAGAVTITARFRAVWNPFTDVKPSDWFHDDVRYVYENSLMQGTGDTTFSPYLTTTRGMIVTILYRLEGEPAVTGTCPFDDVASGKYYEKAIIWAAANGIVEGYGNDKFGPEDPITREQMAAILWRYAKYKDYDVTASADLSKFTDEASISGYAKTALSWANANELINGKGGGILDPDGNAERCQVAAILHRFCANIVK